MIYKGWLGVGCHGVCVVRGVIVMWCASWGGGPRQQGAGQVGGGWRGFGMGGLGPTWVSLLTLWSYIIEGGQFD